MTIFLSFTTFPQKSPTHLGVGICRMLNYQIGPTVSGHTAFGRHRQTDKERHTVKYTRTDGGGKISSLIKQLKEKVKVCPAVNRNSVTNSLRSSSCGCRPVCYMKDLDFILHTGLQCTAAQRPRGHERR